MYPISVNSTTSPRKEITKLIAVFQEAREKEMASNIIKQPPPAPDGPGEGPGTYGVCCDRKRGCDCDGPPSA